MRLGLHRSAATTDAAHASPEALLQLLLRCFGAMPAALPDTTISLSPPRSYFDVDDLGGGIVLAPALAHELMAKPAFSLGCWLHLEAPAGNRSELLFSLLERRNDAAIEVGFEVTLQRCCSS